MQLQRASKFFTSSKRLAVHLLYSIGYEKFVRISLLGILCLENTFPEGLLIRVMEYTMTLFIEKGTAVRVLVSLVSATNVAAVETHGYLLNRERTAPVNPANPCRTANVSQNFVQTEHAWDEGMVGLCVTRHRRIPWGGGGGVEIISLSIWS